MSLSLLTREHKLTHSSAGDLALVSGVFVLALTYLEVPFWNALLFGPAITLQAAVGVVVLTRLLKGVPGSLLLLVGPGLILGGALSFAAFQLVGRGIFGLLVVLALGVGAVVTLVKSTTWQSLSRSRMWTLGQILGLAALALTWEFPELLPVAVAFFTLGFFTSDSPTAPRWLTWTVGVLAFAAIATVPLLRQEYWWLISDDYAFFEMLSQHLTRSGPFADWGATNFSKYHWLSYGWSGLLNALGGQPEAFTTLTRVMPFVYSASLVASILLVVEYTNLGFSRLAISQLPTWLIVSVNPLDWSGTSTAGAFSVLFAFFSTLTLHLVTSQNICRRLAIYLTFLPIVFLTKLPSVYTLLLVIAVCEAIIRTRRHRHFGKSIQLLLISVAFAGVFPLIWLSGNFVNGFVIATINPGLGQLAEHGSVIAAALLLIKKSWLVVTLAIVVVALTRRVIKSPEDTLKSFFVALAPLFVIGIAFDVVMVGNANLHEYFSGPAYLVASITLVSLGHLPSRAIPSSSSATQFLVATLALVIWGYLWSEFKIVNKLWVLISARNDAFNNSLGALVVFVASDRRVGTALVFIVIVALTFVLRQHRFLVLTGALSLIAALVLLSFLDHSEHAFRELGQIRSTSEVSAIYGSVEERDLGIWLRSNSDPGDLIATHHFRDTQSGELHSNFALASWSQREFLVLGPQFLRDTKDLEKKMQLCDSFGAQPSVNGAGELRRLGVDWFVVDSHKSQFLTWDKTWDVRFGNGRFLVVKL